MRPLNSREVRPPISGCLTDELLVDLLDERLPDEALARAHHHAAACDDCRLLLASVSRSGPDGEKEELERLSLEADSPEELGLAWTPPPVFDEFRLERLIGRGGMGMVYLAHDTTLGRSVAVKFIAASQPEPWVRAYFETEARAIARLQHPNVVTVFRVGQINGHPYIVSEYVVGQSLAELPLPVPWRRVLTLGVGLARGLAAAHRQGVLHRDLKPSNALLTQDGEVKLLDFGLAERFGPGEDSALARARLVVGTLPYLAPELLGGAQATPRSDIYALGLVLHELCTGEVPRGTPRPPAPESPRAEGGQGVDPDFAGIIARCLASEPMERFASAEALCEALERLERVSAHSPLAESNPYRGLAPFEAEHRALFFGRDADIRAVLERLHHRPLVLVAGDSGAGKSSLCRAGVVPRVAAGALDDGRQWTTLTLWPGPRPLEALAAALAPILGRKEAEVVSALAQTPSWLGQALREVHLGGRGLLLFIDQLEELLTLSEPVQAAHFARLMGELALPSAGVRVLLAVRGDFLTRLCGLPGLGHEAERALYILRPMSPEGVCEAIVGPARGRGVAFESSELVQTLVASTAHGVGSLPLLQFALAELWERRNPAQGRITRVALEEMGGVAGALTRHADGVLARLSLTEREAARRLLLQLVTEEGTRLERGEEELAEASDGAARAALRALVEGRLLHTRTAGGQPRCEIAHDSLIESWGTLRDWLDDDIGHRVVRKRLEVASTEWERLVRAREALWGQRQLDETRALDPSTMGWRERAFLLASHRAVTRQRWGRWLAVMGLALTVAASYGGVRLQAYLADARFIAAQLGSAREALATGRELAQRASVSREEAMALFDGRPSPSATEPGTQELRSAAERQWTEALALRDQADEAYARASESLEQALDRDRGHVGTRGLFAEVTYERVLLAERFYQQRERDEWARRLEQLAGTGKEGEEWRQRLLASAELELVTDSPGVRVEIDRYIDVQGIRRREPVAKVGSLSPAPIARVSLPEGSYLLHVTQPGRAPLELPVLLAHGVHQQVRLELPATVPEGYAYIPPGCFLLGSAEPEVVRTFMYSPPLHRFCLTEGYLIGRREVTFGDWLTYLEELPPEAPARRLLEQPRFGDGGAVTLRNQAGTGWLFSFHPSQEGFADVLEARVGAAFRYPGRKRRDTADWRRFPLAGVSAVDLEDYFGWLDRTGRLPGARLCGQNEWEYAARGADGRRLPHGDQLLPDDANIDTTYGRQPDAFGPDMVGSHPASVSPFGLEDMAGNAYELTRSATPEFGSVVLRGGSWYYDAFTAYSASLSPGDPTARDARIGVRVCASFSPRPPQGAP